MTAALSRYEFGLQQDVIQALNLYTKHHFFAFLVHWLIFINTNQSYFKSILPSDLQLYDMTHTNHKFKGLISLILLIVAIQSVTTSYPSFIETGTYIFNTVPYFNVPALNIFNSNFDIPLASSKNASNYEAGLSLSSVQLNFMSRYLSLIVDVYDKTTSILVIRVSSASGSFLSILQLRYVIVLTQYAFIRIYHFASANSLNHNLKDTNPKIATIPITITNSAALIHQSYLTGFIVDASSNVKKIDFTPTVTITNSDISIQISTILTSAFIIDFFGYHVITYDSAAMTTTLGGKFITVKLNQASTQNLGYTNASTTITNTNSFFGIRSFHIQSQTALQFSFSFTGTNIAVAMNYIFDYISFNLAIFSTLPCASPNFLLTANSTCWTTCPIGYYGNTTTNTCQLCSNNCQQCSGSSNNCSNCSVINYLAANNSCINCGYSISQCLQCSSSSVCTKCSAVTFVNSTTYQCDANCSLINLCFTCSLVMGNIACLTCNAGYIVIFNICTQNCGDGSLIGLQGCDDGNINNGDGCSANCVVQPYFSCSGTPSICLLTSITIIPIYSLKNQGSNSFTITYHIEPSYLFIYSITNWMSALSISGSVNAAIIKAEYDSSTSSLSITTAYNEDLIGKIIDYNFNPVLLGSFFTSMTAFPLSSFSTVDNNLSLQFYSNEVYVFTQVLQYWSMIVGGACILMFLFGYGGSKLVALEGAAIIQVTSILLLTLKNISPCFHSLRYLRLSFGYNKLHSYDYSSKYIQPEFKAQQFSAQPFHNYNLILIIVFAPFLIAFALKILSVTKFKQNRTLRSKWKQFIGEYALYGLLFCSYSIFISFGLNMRFESVNQTDLGVGLAFGPFFLLLLIVLTIGSNKYAKCFGQFKRKFRIFSSSQYTYNLWALQRFVTSMLVVFLTDFPAQVIIILPLFLGLLAFIIIKKPYVLEGNKRQIINISLLILILVLYIAAKFMEEISYFNIAAPPIILTMLTISLCFNSYYLKHELYEKWRSLTQAHHKFQNQQYSLQETQKMQFQLLQKKIIPNDMLSSIIAQSLPKLNSQQLNLEWQNYANLEKNKLYQQIKQKLMKNKINKKNNQPQLLPLRKDSI